MLLLFRQALLVLAMAYAPGLTAQIFALTPNLGLYGPTRNFVNHPGNFRTRFATTVAYGGTISLRPVRPIGLTLSGLVASPQYNYFVAGFGGGVAYRGSTSGRMSIVALQVSGYTQVTDRASLSLSLGPAWIHSRSRLLPSETTWAKYKSSGISAAIRLQHRFGPLLHGTVTASDVSYVSDVAHGGRQHDIQLLLGIGLGYYE